jgi:ATP-dependent Clp protease protease subunit
MKCGRFVLAVLLAFSIGCSHTAHPDTSNKTTITDQDSVTLYGPVTELSINKAIRKLHSLQNVDIDKPIYLLIDSGGGDVFAGIKLIDAMQSSKRPVYTVVVGKACSMAAFIQSYGVKRYMYPHAFIMFHNATISVPEGTDMNKIESYVLMVKHVIYNLNSKISENTGIPLRELASREQVEWYLLDEEAMETHVVTDIANFVTFPLRNDSEFQPSKDDD